MSLCKPKTVIAFGLALVAGGLSACGFQLRAAPDLPPEMSTTYISADDTYTPFYRKLRVGLQNSGVKIVDSPVQASAVFSVTTDKSDRRVLSVSARNVPTEYEVYYTVAYSVRTADHVILERQSVTLTKDYTYDETLVLGKVREEEVLRDAIVDDLVRIVLRQLSSR